MYLRTVCSDIQKIHVAAFNVVKKGGVEVAPINPEEIPFLAYYSEVL